MGRVAVAVVLKSGAASHQLVERDRQVSDALPRCVEHGIGNRGRDADDTYLAKAFGSERAHDLVLLFDEDHIDVMDIGVDGHVIFPEAVVHESSKGLIDNALLFERHPDSPDHATKNLTARGRRVERSEEHTSEL